MHSVRVRTLFFLAASMTAQAATIGFNEITLATKATDPQLINPWGIAASATSPLWIGNNGSGVSTIYSAGGVKQALVVTIPGDGSVTGVAFNGNAAAFNGDNFLFVSEDGTVSGWRGALGTNAETFEPANIADVYKGLATETTGGFTYGLLANFHSGAIDVLKGSVAAPNLAGAFTDPGLPAGYAPFDVQNLNGVIYVSYAKQDGAKHDEVDGAGLGFVDQFDLNGNFLGRLVSNGVLNAPWGLALAPVGFGNLGGDLLVGNFGDGIINAFNPTTGTYIDTLKDPNGNPLVIDGLWALHFGSGTVNGGQTTSLFVTAGPNGESGGLLARIDPAPEPSTWILFTLGLTALVFLRRRKLS